MPFVRGPALPAGRPPQSRSVQRSCRLRPTRGRMGTGPDRGKVGGLQVPQMRQLGDDRGGGPRPTRGARPRCSCWTSPRRYSASAAGGGGGRRLRPRSGPRRRPRPAWRGGLADRGGGDAGRGPGSRQAAATSTRRHDVAHQELALEPYGVISSAAIADQRRSSRGSTVNRSRSPVATKRSALGGIFVPPGQRMA